MYLLFKFKDNVSKYDYGIDETISLVGIYDTKEEAIIKAIKKPEDLIEFSDPAINNRNGVMFSSQLMQKNELYFKIIEFKNEEIEIINISYIE